MVIPYIVFNGNCAEALSFYAKAFETEIALQQPYGDYVPVGNTVEPEILRAWILHAEMEIEGTSFWFADEATGISSGNMMRLTVTVPAKNKAQKIFDCLSAGGIVTLPPTETFYSSFHAAATDKYGVCWNVVAEEAPHKPEI